MRSYDKPVSREGGTFNTFTLTSSPYNDGRRRRKHNKTFTGCIICKKRKVRCTEEKPSCARCVRTKAVCCYKPPLVWVFESSESGTTQWSLPSPSVSPSPAADTSLSTKDRRALFYYQEYAAPIFSCFFGRDFWTTIALQMGHQHGAVRDLLIGAAALFEMVEAQTPDTQLTLQMEFFSKYSRAVSTIAKSSHEQRPEMVLTASVMLASFEMITGSMERAIVHVKAGINITQNHLKRLEQDGKAKSPQALFIGGHILPNIAGHALQAHIYGISFLPMQEICQLISEDYQLPHIPESFAHVKHAFSCLAGIVHHLVLVDTSADRIWALNYIDKLESLLRGWERCFDSFQIGLSISGRSEVQLDLIVLRSNLGLARIVLQALRHGFERPENEIDISSAEYGLLCEYKEMEAELQHRVNSDRAADSASSEYTPPIIMVTVTSKTNNVQHSPPAQSKEQEDPGNSMSWSNDEALATAKAILSKTSPHISTSTAPTRPHNEHQPGSTRCHHHHLASVDSINIEYLHLPQQLSNVGLLIPRLPPSTIDDIHLVSHPVCSRLPLDDLAPESALDSLGREIQYSGWVC